VSLEKFDIIFAGVGGQGVLTIAGIVARAALLEGYDVKAAELHGLAMRFGAVETHLRFGTKIFSPLVKTGEADLVISLEPVEAVRASVYANKKTSYVFDTKDQAPIGSHLEKKPYPSMDEIVSTLKKFSPQGKVVKMDASDIAKKNYGSVVAANTLILGKALAEGLLPLKKESIIHAMSHVMNEKVFEENKKILELSFSIK